MCRRAADRSAKRWENMDNAPPTTTPTSEVTVTQIELTMLSYTSQKPDFDRKARAQTELVGVSCRVTKLVRSAVTVKVLFNLLATRCLEVCFTQRVNQLMPRSEAVHDVCE